MNVCVIIPCFREPLERVQRTVDSCFALPNVDRVILVDDGCNDEALDTIETVDVIHLPANVGPADAMNVGVRATNAADIICRLDVGDVFLPAKAAQIEAVKRGVAASMSPHLDAVEGVPFHPPADWARRIWKDGVFCICTAVLTRAAFDAAGGFDPSLRYGDDWDFAMKVQHRIGWTLHPSITCEAGAFEGGHTKGAAADPVKAARKYADGERVKQRGHAIAHPGRQPLRPAR